jgi:hypothetical protein
MGMGVNPYPPVYMGDSVGLFFCRGYGYGVVIPGGYLPIAISSRACIALICAIGFESRPRPAGDTGMSGSVPWTCGHAQNQNQNRPEAREKERKERIREAGKERTRDECDRKQIAR